MDYHRSNPYVIFSFGIDSGQSKPVNISRYVIVFQHLRRFYVWIWIFF